MKERDSLIQIRDYIQILRRSVLTIVVFVAIGVVAAFGITLLKKPIFVSAVELVVEQQRGAAVVGPQFTPLNRGDATGLETQIRVIRSPALVAHTIDLMLNWLKTSSVADNGEPSSAAMPSAIEMIDQAMRRTSKLGEYVQGREPRSLRGELRSGLTVSFLPRTRILRIRIRSRNADFAAAAANMTAQAYADYVETTTASSTQRMFLMLKRQADEASRSIKSSAAALLEFKKRAEVASMTGDVGTTNGENPVEAEKVKERLALGNVEIVALRDELDEVVEQVELLSKRYKPGHPRMQTLLSKQTLLEAKIRKETDMAYAQWERAHLKEQGAVEYSMLEQDLEATRRLHELLVSKMKEIDLTRDAPSARVQILETARASSRPTSPNKPLNLTLGAVSGLMAGLLLAFVSAFRRSNLISLSTTEDDLPAQLLGSLPHVKEDELPRILQGTADHASPATESFNTMRTVIESLLASAQSQDIPDMYRKIILITSPDRGEGKSTISTALAQSLAKLNKRVLLVDVDLRRGQLHETLDVAGDNGLSDLLQGNGHIAPREISSNLWFFSRGTATMNPSELLASAAMQSFAEQAGAEYDVVILDSPPLLPVTDAALVARYAAIRIVVARSLRTHLAACRQSSSILQNLGHRVDGIILNDVQDTERSYYGYYRTAYYRGYSESGDGRK
jgi:capsular exopolysaccharide synthesis family protein